MAQVLLIDDAPKLASIYSLNLRIYVGLEVIWKTSLADAKGILDIIPNIDLIITKATIQQKDIVPEILEVLSSMKVAPKVIVLGNDENYESTKGVYCMSPLASHKEIVLKAAKLTGVTAKDMAELNLPEMYEIPISYINFIDEVVCDFFMLINENKEGASQFVEIGTEGVDIKGLKSNINFYVNQGAKKFFIPSKDRVAFVNAYSAQVLQSLAEKDAPEEVKIAATAAAMDAVSSNLVKGDFSPSSINLARESMKSLAKFAKANTDKKILKLLGSFLKHKVSFRFKRVQATIILVNESLKHLDWGTQEHIDKLCYVAFFHDILLYTDDMARITTDAALEESNLIPRDKKIVRNHALWTLDLLKDYPETHMGATILIKQHHGQLTGIGFNDNPGAGISPLAIVFIVCEEYANQMIEQYEQEVQRIDHRKILNYLLEKYPKSQYTKVTRSLKGLLNQE